MKTLMRAGTLLVLVGILAHRSAHAQQARQPQALVLVASNLSAGDSAHRALTAKGRDAATVLPGDEVRYDLRFTNTLRDSVQKVTFANPLPAGMQYVSGSAGADRPDVLVEYSADGGRTFSEKPMVERQVDGRTVREAAPSESYTNVRWQIRGWVLPGAQVTAQFRAKLKPAS